MRSMVEGALGRYRFSIVRNTHEQRAPLSPRFARHFPRLGRGKLNVVIKSFPCPARRNDAAILASPVATGEVARVSVTVGAL